MGKGGGQAKKIALNIGNGEMLLLKKKKPNAKSRAKGPPSRNPASLVINWTPALKYGTIKLSSDPIRIGIGAPPRAHPRLLKYSVGRKAAVGLGDWQPVRYTSWRVWRHPLVLWGRGGGRGLSPVAQAVPNETTESLPRKVDGTGRAYREDRYRGGAQTPCKTKV